MGKNSVPFSETQSLTYSVTRVMGSGAQHTQLSQQVRLPSIGSVSVFLPKRSSEWASSPHGVYGKPSAPQRSEPPLLVSRKPSSHKGPSLLPLDHPGVYSFGRWCSRLSGRKREAARLWPPVELGEGEQSILARVQGCGIYNHPGACKYFKRLFYFEAVSN